MQARYYDPVIGRFYSNDPIGFRDVHSFNRYAYANNNPYRYTDPTGMISEGNKKMNQMSEASFDRMNPQALSEIWIYYDGMPLRRMDRGWFDVKSNTLHLTEIKGFKNESSIKQAKRRMTRSVNPIEAIQTRAGRIASSTQQMRDKFIMHSADKGKLSIPRFKNLDLNDVKLNINWAVYEFNSKGTSINKLHTYDMGSIFDTWNLYQLNYTKD